VVTTLILNHHATKYTVTWQNSVTWRNVTVVTEFLSPTYFDLIENSWRQGEEVVLVIPPDVSILGGVLWFLGKNANFRWTFIFLLIPARNRKYYAKSIPKTFFRTFRAYLDGYDEKVRAQDIDWCFFWQLDFQALVKPSGIKIGQKLSFIFIWQIICIHYRYTPSLRIPP